MSEIQNNTESKSDQLYSPDKIKQYLMSIATYCEMEEYPHGNDVQFQSYSEIRDNENKEMKRNEHDFNPPPNALLLSNSNQIPILFNGWNYGYSNNTTSSIANFTIKTLSLKENFQNLITIYCFLLLAYILYM